MYKNNVAFYVFLCLTRFTNMLFYFILDTQIHSFATIIMKDKLNLLPKLRNQQLVTLLVIRDCS